MKGNLFRHLTKKISAGYFLMQKNSPRTTFFVTQVITFLYISLDLYRIQSFFRCVLFSRPSMDTYLPPKYSLNSFFVRHVAVPKRMKVIHGRSSIFIFDKKFNTTKGSLLIILKMTRVE